MEKKKIALISNILVAVAALVVFVALFLDVSSAGESSNVFDAFKNVKAPLKISPLLMIAVIGTMATAILAFLFAVLRILADFMSVDLLKKANSKIGGIVFAVLGLLVLVFAILFFVGISAPYSGTGSKIGNDEMKALIKEERGLATILALIGGIITLLGAATSTVILHLDN